MKRFLYFGTALLLFLGIMGCGSGSTEADLTPPVLLSAIISDDAPDTLVLTFSKAVTGSTKGWSLGDDDPVDAVPATEAVGNGTATWKLGLTPAAAAGNKITISYDATEGDTKDTDGNKLKSITSRAVVNNVGNPDGDTTAPTLTAAVVEAAAPAILVLTFSEPVIFENLNGWTLTGASISTATAPTGSDTATINITLGAAVTETAILILNYDATKGSVGDLSGNKLAAIASRPVANKTDVTPPTLLSAIIYSDKPNELVLTFSEAVTYPETDTNLNGWNSNGAGGFKDPLEITGKGTATWKITVKESVSKYSRVEIMYSGGTTTDIAGNPLADFEKYQTVPFRVPGDTTPPTLVSAEATVGTKLLVLTFSEDVTAGDMEDPSTIISITNNTFNITGEPLGFGTSVWTIDLGTTVASGASMTFTYTKPAAGGIEDFSGNPLATVSKVVTIKPADTTPPTFSNATISGKVLTLTFSKPVTMSMNGGGGEGEGDGGPVGWDFGTLPLDKMVDASGIGTATWKVTFEITIPAGSYVVAYDGTGDAADLSGNKLPSFTKTIVVP